MRVPRLGMKPDDLLRLDLPLFAGLVPADLKGLDLPFVERRYAAWEMLFNQEEQSRDVYFLLSGALLALFWTREGREVIFGRFVTGAYFGELAALDEGGRSLAVVARTDVHVLALPDAAFRALVDRVPALRWRIIRDLVSRIRSLNARNLELTTLTVEQRVASFLMALAMERGQLRKGGVIDDAPTHAEIAASIGSNREMVSRTMTSLARKGAIRTARMRIEFLDPKVLANDF